MKNETYGYVRVSTKDQNEARQMIAMQDFGVDEDHIFIEKQSGKVSVKTNSVRNEQIKPYAICFDAYLSYSIELISRDSSCRIQHILDEYPISSCWIIDQNMDKPMIPVDYYKSPDSRMIDRSVSNPSG